MDLVWDAQIPCSPGERGSEAKFVLMALADNANQEGYCWPSLDTIARRCNMTRQGVINNISKLEAWGWLSVEREGGKSNKYHINVAAIRTAVNLVDPSTPLTRQPAIPVNGVDPNRYTLNKNVRNNTVNNKVIERDSVRRVVQEGTIGANGKPVQHGKPLVDVLCPSTFGVTESPVAKPQLPKPTVQVHAGNQAAAQILTYLNLKAKREFQLVHANLKFIVPRLAEPGITIERVKLMIDSKVTEWFGDPKMERYLNPKTLFCPSNFQRYYDDAGHVVGKKKKVRPPAGFIPHGDDDF